MKKIIFILVAVFALLGCSGIKKKVESILLFKDVQVPPQSKKISFEQLKQVVKCGGEVTLLDFRKNKIVKTKYTAFYQLAKNKRLDLKINNLLFEFVVENGQLYERQRGLKVKYLDVNTHVIIVGNNKYMLVFRPLKNDD
ncbi:MAG: membrane lipoprotein lipid attachment site-containing protein [Desulfonauticus sp.]|nr:membrane lipoprotein lipid attachment site-containing protein [Desulfonauticus sp.]